MDGTEATMVAVTSGEAALLTEHYSKRVIPGDVESVRVNLKFALEKLDYFVENEQPSLVAKRKTQLSNYAGKLLAGDVLPFVKRLQISLKPSSENSTVAEFAYGVLNSGVTKGDRRTIEHEIDALVALASSRKLQTVCPACGTINPNDSRFCRVCGVPNAARELAEIEVLRLSANARAAYQNIVGGAILIVCWIAFVLLLWSLSRQSATSAALISGAGMLFGMLWSLYGIVQLHRTLNPSPDSLETLAAAYTSPKISTAQTDFLPPPSAQVSVTEGTTELLNPLREKITIDEGRKTKEFQ